ncbi:hypothetical protein [Streptomyces sp. NPDC056672]|uniref:hypothetical protein n=1 Tax=Streptomyces sp. NPDC056672 TaxID=3345906 RepID=UPI0036C4A6C3
MADDTDTDEQVAAQATADDEEAEKPEVPQRWVWPDMDPDERIERLVQLVEWVDWLVEAEELRTKVARCWFRHEKQINLFTALYLSWVRTYAGDPTKLGIRAELEWIKDLKAMEPYMARPSCQSGHDEPAGATYSMIDAFEAWLTERERSFLDAPRRHPAQAQAFQLARAKRLESAAKAA